MCVRETGLVRAPLRTVKLQELLMSILVFTFTLNGESVWYFRGWIANLALCYPLTSLASGQIDRLMTVSVDWDQQLMQRSVCGVNQFILVFFPSG